GSVNGLGKDQRNRVASGMGRGRRVTTDTGHEAPATEASVGGLVSRASEHLSTLVRDEIQLVQSEMAQKGRRAGKGFGLFGGAGAVAWFGAGALVAAAILGLSVAIAPWLAAIIVGVVLLLIAGILAAIGKKEVARAAPM